MDFTDPSLPLRAGALMALQEADPHRKCAQAAALHGRLLGGEPADPDWQVSKAPTGLPGRPALPRLVHPAQVPQRSPFTPAGRAALIHAICHIEFNAINLALDAVWRFGGMPPDFYADWLRVAAEEATHFQLLQQHLSQLGHAYGDFDAHDGLWMMAERTQADALARMALVPRTLEARGLDATPPIQARLREAGDTAAVAILDVILRDEIGHVAVGNRWYRWLCDRQGLEPVAHYRELARQHRAPRLHGPFNLPARRQAGFTAEELEALQHGDRQGTSTPAGQTQAPQSGA
ncbi:ferritin-like domain-containing protein [Ideonella livida]|uniref:Ferritin-like domain-containing protein n=1 Tax=Ideonella livida TaxID=2707176 RepID=A0A7C9TLA3_9BURK|nr:ferritin-like domain-containing protein [Ideonella livida]NDY90826.1 ferritin-like domain-containing protein [Ideonella livida]